VAYGAGAGAAGVGGRSGSGSGSRASSGSARARSATAAASLADGKVGRASAEVALDGKDLVIVGAEFHAKAGPGVEVVGESDGSGRALVAADRPELLESAGALDGGGVGALVGVHVVGVAVGGDRALLCCARAGVECAEVLDDVVFDQGVFLLKTCGQC